MKTLTPQQVRNLNEFDKMVKRLRKLSLLNYRQALIEEAFTLNELRDHLACYNVNLPNIIKPSEGIAPYVLNEVELTNLSVEIEDEKFWGPADVADLRTQYFIHFIQFVSAKAIMDLTNLDVVIPSYAKGNGPDAAKEAISWDCAAVARDQFTELFNNVEHREQALEEVRTYLEKQGYDTNNWLLISEASNRANLSINTGVLFSLHDMLTNLCAYYTRYVEEAGVDFRSYEDVLEAYRSATR